MINNYRTSPQLTLGIESIWVDNFSGGGGASTGIEAAIGRPVDIAINHDRQAISMHTVNHPQTKHYCESVFDVDPAEAAAGRPIAGVWLSPDCRHFSKAKGGTPVKKEIRGLAWVAIRWALAGARDIFLENVGEFQTWGPLVHDEEGNAYPCPERRGETFRAFVDILGPGIGEDHPGYLECLEALDIEPNSADAKRITAGFGYNVDWRELKACDYGIPTTRQRLFLVARGDGQQVEWPKPTHGPGLKKYKTAADIIDWSIPCPSIFTRKRPLAENTLRRIARGIQRFVIDNPKPFIVRIGQTGFGGDRLQYSVDQPLTTITSKAEHCLVAPRLMPNQGDNQAQLCAAFLAKHFGGVTGVELNTPFPTITSIATQNQIVTSSLVEASGDSPASQRAGEVRAFLLKYYSEGGQWQGLDEPLHTIPTKHRLGLVTVAGVDYQIVDIGMRMLEPHELYAAQGFPANYIFDRDSKGKPITKTQQVAKCGNSVPPGLAKAVVEANLKARAASKAA